MPPLETILRFLEEIGIPAREGDVAADSFLPGVRIERGALVFDRASLRWPSDLLHEAGHIAVMPPGLRPGLDDALDAATPAHAGEVEAMAWAYAAAVHLKLDIATLFHEGGYRGHSPGLVTTFSMGVYPGAFGLAQAGMAEAGVYPRMTRWLRA